MDVLNSTDAFLAEVFDDIILGRNVKRSYHYLLYDGKVYSELFKERLRLHRFWPRLVSKVNVDLQHQVPAFYLVEDSCFFGYVCWQIIDRDQTVKIWKSEIKDDYGKSRYIIQAGQNKTVWVNLNLKEKRNEQ
jgi:hypothetical protein